MWDAEAHAVTRESELMRETVRAGGFTTYADRAGLRAGGGTAAGLAGPESSGYSSGSGLLSAFGIGRIVGSELAGR